MEPKPGRSTSVEDVVLEHDYDGIQEYDNPLPRWWLMCFYASMVFAVIYVLWYHFGPGPLMAEELAQEVAAAQARAAGSTPTSEAEPEVDPYAALVGDAERTARGQPVYAARCAACHGPDGGGLVGPNLTDRFWKHGGQMRSLVRVISRGVPGTAMVAWNQQLSEAEVVDVALYVKSLQGTTPANPKAPEGVESHD